MDEISTVAATLVRCIVSLLSLALLLTANPLLLDCAVFWAHRAWQGLLWLPQGTVHGAQDLLADMAEAWLEAIQEEQQQQARPRPGRRAPPRAVSSSALDRLVLRYIHWHRALPRSQQLLRPVPRQPPSLPPRRLCPNGDHGNVEETRILLNEHFRCIHGAILLAVVMSWLLVPLLAPSPDHAKMQLTNVHVQAPLQELPETNYIVVDNSLPRHHHRRPPSQSPPSSSPPVGRLGDDVLPEVSLAVRSLSPPSQPPLELPPIGASGFAAARKAARAAQAAHIDAAASAYVSAVRQRIIAENNGRDGGSSSPQTANDADDNEASLALPILSLAGDVDVDVLFDRSRC